MRHMLSVILLFLFTTATAQSDILLPAVVSNPMEEYSALVVAGSSLLLVPQYPDQHTIYAVETGVIQKKLSRGKPIPAHTFSSITLRNMESVKQRINAIRKVYEGVEGAVAVGNTVFLSIETTEKTDSCFLVKGYLHKNTITLDTRYLQPIPKVHCNDKRVDNAGYESLTYLPDQHKLLAVFEYTNVADVHQTPVGWLIDTSLADPKSAAPIYIEQPIPFRISDICHAGDGQLYGINFWWAGEYNDYFSCNPHTPLPVADSTAFTDASHKNTCYARLLQLQLIGNTLHWTPWKEIGYDCYNWEGIAALQQSLFIISDANKGKYAEKTTHFKAFPR